MPLDIRTRKRLIKQCDPQLPLPAGDPRYVALDMDPPTRGERSCVDRLRETILLSDESCQLFTGFPGTGKTTELQRLAGEMRDDAADPSHVIFIDFNDFIDVYSPISIVDVIRVIAYAMDRSATLREGGDPDQRPGYLQRLFDFMATHDLGLKEFGFEAYGGSLMLEFKNNPSFRQRLEAAVQGRFQRFVEDARTFIRQAVARILNADGANAERVVVIADALEKLTPLREEDRSLIEGCVETLYLSHQSLLQLPCHVIYTFPLWLRFRAANLGALYGREPLVLPMVKLAGREGQEFSVGVDKLVALVQRRVEDLGAVFGETLKDTLLPLVRASGGFPRDLLRMVRSLLLDAPAFPIRPEDTRRVVAELARTYEYTLLGTYFDVLAQVHRTQTMPADDLAARNLAGFLFERWLILAYHNGAEWFALHPLVLGSPRMQQHLKATAS